MIKPLLISFLIISMAILVSAITPGDSPYGLLDNSVQYNVTSGGDNASWNQTLAGTLYAPIGAGSDNVSWNQTLAGTLYADISLVGDNSSWNETYAWTKFVPYTGANQNVDLSIFNITTSGVNIGNSNPIYALEVYGTNDYNSSAEFWRISDDSKSSEIIFIKMGGTTGTPSSVSEKDNLAAFRGIGYSEAQESIITGAGIEFSASEDWGVSTGARIGFNATPIGTTGAVRVAWFEGFGMNMTNRNITNVDYITANYFMGDGSALTGISGDNESWNQTYANTLYAAIGWGYNMTTATYNLYNAVWSSTRNATYEADWNNTYNETYASFATNVSLNYTKIVFDTYNSTWDDVGGSGGNASWNETRANTLYQPIGVSFNQTYHDKVSDNESWNQTYANTLYEPIRDSGETVMKFEGSKFMIKLT